MVDSLINNNSFLRRFVPINALDPVSFRDLTQKICVEEVAVGTTIFKEGDVDGQSIYLVEGQLNLLRDGVNRVVVSDTEMARHALAPQQPRQKTCVAKTDAKVIRIDTNMLDIPLTWNQLSSGIEVGELRTGGGSGSCGDDSGDWMTRLLQSRAFLQVPPANIQAVFMSIEEVEVKAGELVIKQGADGDYYYLIKSGKCQVVRESKSGSELVLATLSDGDSFGEESLLSEAKRNANVIMITDGTLMRLSKSDFNRLLKEPMLSWVTPEQTREMVANGAILMDVRLDSEFKNSRIEGAVNLPLFTLRSKADTLDRQKQYVLYCDTGRRSSAGAFLLSERGFEVYCFRGEITDYQ